MLPGCAAVHLPLSVARQGEVIGHAAAAALHTQLALCCARRLPVAVAAMLQALLDALVRGASSPDLARIADSSHSHTRRKGSFAWRCMRWQCWHTLRPGVHGPWWWWAHTGEAPPPHPTPLFHFKPTPPLLPVMAGPATRPCVCLERLTAGGPCAPAGQRLVQMHPCFTCALVQRPTPIALHQL